MGDWLDEKQIEWYKEQYPHGGQLIRRLVLLVESHQKYIGRLLDQKGTVIRSSTIMSEGKNCGGFTETVSSKPTIPPEYMRLLEAAKEIDLFFRKPSSILPPPLGLWTKLDIAIRECLDIAIRECEELERKSGIDTDRKA